MTDTIKQEYDTQAANYTSKNIPLLQLDDELLISALGDATGDTVLDLAGGSGLKARIAIDAGAVAVDVVDISRDMMQEGQKEEKALDRDVIRWFEADISKPLGHLPLQPQYDIVMAHWPFDHADSMETLEGMLRNTVAYLKPGGRFFGSRVRDPYAPAVQSGELGVVYKDHEEFPGGVRYRWDILGSFSAGIEAASMNATLSGATEIYGGFGLVNVQIESYENTATVRENPQLWESFLQQPAVELVKATKKL
ncbi:S-adenosyl-L-methionine-dependent methyltransferase [Nemania sp. FL0916]|nr:S-adenosyl-L-methionine-dependent methyltransferase [Nemania sp. FL0916]